MTRNDWLGFGGAFLALIAHQFRPFGELADLAVFGIGCALICVLIHKADRWDAAQRRSRP